MNGVNLLKSTGVIKKMDDLGRIVIPKEMRRILNIHDGEILELYVNDDNLILKKHSSFEGNVNKIKRLIDLYDSLDICKIVVVDKEEVIVEDRKIDYSDKKVLIVDDNNLNMTKVNQHAQYTCDFFKQMASFEATMKELFRGFSFFGIASYGFDVSDKANQNRNVQPSMVELPFLWTLATFGCINAKEIHTTTTILKKTVTNVNDITNQNELYFKGR